MAYSEKEYKLKSNTRADIRREITNLFIEEEAGCGKNDLSSKYTYIVEKYDEYKIELHRPAGLNKGYDFTVNIIGMYFKKTRRRTYPSHDDIKECLTYVKETYSPQDYAVVREQIIETFNCGNPDVSETRGIYFVDYMGVERPIAIILLAIKWLFIEQDITYWNWSGRNMLMNGLKEAGLV